MTALELLMWAILIWSSRYNVDPQVAQEVVYLESTYDVNAVGDEGRALGAWQYHEGAWSDTADAMIEAGEIEERPPLEDRANPWVSTRMAMYAMGEMNNGERWWATWNLAEQRVEEAKCTPK